MTAELYALAPVPPIEPAMVVPGNEPRDYRWYLIERGLAPRTVSLYTAAVLRADVWCEVNGYPLRTVPGLVLAEYVKTLPKSWTTRRQLCSALKHYWNCFDRKDHPVWAVKVPKRPRMICRALSVEEAQRLAERASAAAAEGDRRGAAVLLGLYQGLRREEISQTAWHDFTEDGWLKVFGKGDKPAMIPVHPAVAQAVANLPRVHDVWLFLGRKGTDHVGPTTVWTWTVSLAEEVGIENMSTHRLRHTALATALDSTGDLRAVRDFARHASVETTQSYTRTTERRLRAVMEAISYDGDGG